MKEQLGCPREASLGERDAPESALGRAPRADRHAGEARHNGAHNILVGGGRASA
jgi:hypothetical protein